MRDVVDDLIMISCHVHSVPVATKVQHFVQLIVEKQNLAAVGRPALHAQAKRFVYVYVYVK